MTHQPTTSGSVRRLKGDTIDLLARDLNVPREEVFTAVISNGLGNFQLLVPEDAKVEGPPREQQKRSTLDIMGRLVDEIATLQRQAITQRMQLSYYTIFPMTRNQRRERHCKKVITETGDIDHQDSTVT